MMIKLKSGCDGPGNLDEKLVEEKEKTEKSNESGISDYILIPMYCDIILNPLKSDYFKKMQIWYRYVLLSPI